MQNVLFLVDSDPESAHEAAEEEKRLMLAAEFILHIFH